MLTTRPGLTAISNCGTHNGLGVKFPERIVLTGGKMVANSILIVTTHSVELEGLPFTTELVNNTIDAVKRIAMRNYKAVFCDCASLGDGNNGYRLIRELRKQGYTLPIFLMRSALQAMKSHWSPVPAGANGLITCTRKAIIDAMTSFGQVTFKRTSSAAPSPTLAVHWQALEECAVQALKAHVGPVAAIMVREARLRNDAVEDFVCALVRNIDGEHARKEFIAALRKASE
jgi:hypothetical protein